VIPGEWQESGKTHSQTLDLLSYCLGHCFFMKALFQEPVFSSIRFVRSLERRQTPQGPTSLVTTAPTNRVNFRQGQ
jgi:hypothetical protein